MAQKKPKDSSRKKSPATRVDPAHVPVSQMPPAAAAPLASVGALVATPEKIASEASAAGENATGVKAVAMVEQVRRQAGQLSEHLRRQQAKVDHREAELNSRLAAIEKEVRAARLWLGERQQQLDEAKADLARQQKELEARLRAVELKETNLAASEGKLNAQQREQLSKLVERESDIERGMRQLDAREKQLDEREQAINRHAEELRRREENLSDQLAALTTRGSELDQQSHERARQIFAEQAALENRRANLEAAENLLGRQQSELFEQRRQIAVDKTQFHDTTEMEKRRLQHQHQQAAAELAKREKAWQERHNALEARAAALEQLRNDVVKAQEETLEMRLATEELWARLCGTMAPAALTQSIAQVRRRLAEQHSLAERALADQKTELQTLSLRLAEQHEKLASAKQDFQAWAAQRDDEIERQAKQLVSRERQLDAQEAEFQQLELRWQEERATLQQEVRRLLGRLRSPAAIAA